MATFSSSEITQLAKAFKTSSDVMTLRLAYFETLITDDDKTEVLSMLDEWAIADKKYTDIEPNERNFGARIRARQQADNIREQIAGLLSCQDLLESSGSSSQGVVIPL